MCGGAIEKDPWCLKYVPDHLKTEKMSIKAVEKEAEALEDIPEHFQTREMCIKTVEKEAERLEHVPDHFKTGEICKGPLRPICTPQYFVLIGSLLKTNKIMVQ